MQNRKMSVRQAILLGQLFINGGVLVVMVGVWILSFVVVVQAKLSVWLILGGIFAGPIIAWPWWSFAKPRWQNWAVKRVGQSKIEDLLQAAVATGLAWPAGHVFEMTEIKPDEPKQVDILFTLSTMEVFLKKNITKVRYFQRRGVDTKVVDEISVFAKNIRHEIDSSGHVSDFRSDIQIIDDFITRLEKSNSPLQKESIEKRMDWFGITSELTNRLIDTKESLDLYKDNAGES